MKLLTYLIAKSRLLAKLSLGVALGSVLIWLRCQPAGGPDVSPDVPSGRLAAPSGVEVAAYPDRLAYMDAVFQDFVSAVPESPARMPPLMESREPLDHICGLAMMAGLDRTEDLPAANQHPPEIWLAAADLCAARFNPAAARALLDHWIDGTGGEQAAGELAHTLLIEARLPHGGGNAALDLMESVNDPQAIFINLYEFAVNPRLIGPIRTEALHRLRDRMEPEAYRDIVRECAQRARDDNDPWAVHAERLLEEMDTPAPVIP